MILWLPSPLTQFSDLRSMPVRSSGSKNREAGQKRGSTHKTTSGNTVYDHFLKPSRSNIRLFQVIFQWRLDCSPPLLLLSRYICSDCPDDHWPWIGELGQMGRYSANLRHAVKEKCTTSIGWNRECEVLGLFNCTKTICMQSTVSNSIVVIV